MISMSFFSPLPSSTEKDPSKFKVSATDVCTCITNLQTASTRGLRATPRSPASNPNIDDVDETALEGSWAHNSVAPLEGRSERDAAPGKIVHAERSSVPAWLASPDWALHSFSASLFPPPTTVVSAPSQNTPGSTDPVPRPEISERPYTTLLPSTQLQSGVSFRPTTSAIPTQFIPRPLPSLPQSATANTPISSSSPITATAISTASTAPPQGPPSKQEPTDSHSKTAAIAVGVVVPVVCLTILAFIAFSNYKRRRRVVSESTAQCSIINGRFDAYGEGGSSTAPRRSLPAKFKGFWLQVKRLGGPQEPLPSVSNTDVESEKSPATYKPSQRQTTIISKLGRLPSPSQRPQIEHHSARVNSTSATLTDVRGGDTTGMDFHCGGDTPENQHIAKFTPVLPNQAQFATATCNVNPRDTRHAQSTSWLSISSLSSSQRPASLSHVEQEFVPPVPPLLRPPALRSPVDDTEDTSAQPHVGDTTPWHIAGRGAPQLDNYRSGVDARDFAQRNYTLAPETRASDERTSVSLSSGPWSDSDEEEMVEVPLTRGSDVEPGAGATDLHRV